MAVIKQYAVTIVILTVITVILVTISLHYTKHVKSVFNKNNEVLAIHNLTNLENKFCNVSIHLQSSNDGLTLDDSFIYESNYCTSVHNLFMLLKNGCTYERNYIMPNKIAYNLFNNDLMDIIINLNSSIDKFDENVSRKSTNVDDEHCDKVDDDEGTMKADDVEDLLEIDDSNDKFNENTNHITSLTYVVICLMLLLSMAFNLVEFWQERKRKKAVEESQGVAPSESSTGSRRMSIADLTVSRHARKESQQRDSITCHSGHSQLGRRSSFPAQIPEFLQNRARLMPKRQQTWSPPGTLASKRLSFDLNDDDYATDRRRIRIIRRH